MSRAPDPAPRPPAPYLSRRLALAIAARGPITFAEFMEAALYDPQDGFYSRPAVGEGGHFVTGPHLSPVFGVLVARQVEEFWDLLGRPRPFHVVEVGAGDGTLAVQVLEALPETLRAEVRYTAVERTAWGREALKARGVAPAADLAEVAPVPRGCVLANELLDNLPFHLVVGAEGGPRERLVGVREGRFVLVEGPPSSPEVAALAGRLRPGQEAAVCPGALRFVSHAARVLGRGYVWVADYGYAGGRPPTPVHGYRDHRVVEDVLADPGSRDITAGVDFDSLAAHARAIGLRVWGPVPQRQALLALGFRELDARARVRQVEAIAARRGIEALRIYSNRVRANLLLAPDGPGGLQVLCLGVGVDVPPRSVRPPDPRPR